MGLVVDSLALYLPVLASLILLDRLIASRQIKARLRGLLEDHMIELLQDRQSGYSEY